MGVRLAELVATFSLATDLWSGQPVERSLRGYLLAVRIGNAAGLSEDQPRAYYASLVQYVGCTTEANEIPPIWGDEIAAGRPPRSVLSRQGRGIPANHRVGLSYWRHSAGHAGCGTDQLVC